MLSVSSTLRWFLVTNFNLNEVLAWVCLFFVLGASQVNVNQTNIRKDMKQFLVNNLSLNGVNAF